MNELYNILKFGKTLEITAAEWNDFEKSRIAQDSK